MQKHTWDASGNAAGQMLGVTVVPHIIAQPVDRLAEPGHFVTFSVVVEDTSGVTFKWKFNGDDMNGKTGDSLLLTPEEVKEGLYSVVVTNSAGSVTSESATLVLRENPIDVPIVGSVIPLSLRIYSDNGGSVTVAPLKSQYSMGDRVTVTAVPSADHVFVGWIGDLNSNSVSHNLILDGNKTVRARFVSIRPELFLYSGPGGNVRVTPMQLSYEVNQPVSITATSFPPSVFLGWTGDLNSTNNPHALTMDKSRTIRARFATAVSLLPGLIGLWRGETDASDPIGGHHGKFLAGPAEIEDRITASGKVGGAFEFDGTVHIRIPDSPAVRPPQFTAEAWVFPTAAPNNVPQTILARGNVGHTWDLRLVDRVPQFWSHGSQGLTGPRPIPLNEWTHLAVSFDGMTKRLYVNGAEVASHAEPRALVYNAAVPMTIGSDWTSNASSNLFNGRIDEIALYNRALTAEEVLSIYNADTQGKNYSQPYFKSPSLLPMGLVGTAYARQVDTVLGISPVTFSLVEGFLPSGINLSSSGMIDGVPAASGTFRFTVRATDAVGAFTDQRCVLHI